MQKSRSVGIPNSCEARLSHVTHKDRCRLDYAGERSLECGGACGPDGIREISLICFGSVAAGATAAPRLRG